VKPVVGLAVLFVVVFLCGPVALIWAIILTKRLRVLEARQETLKRRLSTGRRLSDDGREGLAPQEEQSPPLESTPEPVTPPPVEASKEPAPISIPPVESAQEPAPPPLDRREKSSVERFIGMRALNWVGVITILFGVASALKVAYSKGWLGDWTVNLLVYALGLILLGGGHFLRRRGFGLAAEGLSALGFGVLFAASYCARHLFGIVSDEAAFSIMAATTLCGGLLSAYYRSQVVAGLIFLGGYLTPVLLATGEDHGVFLVCYLALLGCAAGAFTYAFRWIFVKLLSFMATWLIFLGWYLSFGHDRPGVALAGTAVFFFLHSLAPVLPILVGKLRSDVGDLVAVSGNALFCIGFLYDILADRNLSVLALTTLAQGVFFLLQYLAFRRRGLEQSLLGLASLILSVGFFTTAVPIDLGQVATAITWAAEGALLLALGLGARKTPLLIGSVACLALSLGELLLLLPLHESSFTPIFNGPFCGWVFLVAACALCASWWGGVAFGRSDRYPAQGTRRAFCLLFAMAAGLLFCFTCAAEIILHWELNRGLSWEKAMPWVWIVGAAVSVVYSILAARLRQTPLAIAGFVLYAVTFVSLVVAVFRYHEEEFLLFLNPCFASALFVVLAGSVHTRLQGASREKNRGALGLTFSVLAGGVIWIASVNEVFFFCTIQPSLSEANAIPYVWISGIVPAVLLALGAVRRRIRGDGASGSFARAGICFVAADLVIFAITCFFYHRSTFTPVCNAGFLCGLALALSFAAAARWLSWAGGIGKTPFMWGAFILVLFQLLSVESYQYFVLHPGLGGEGKLWALSSLSVLWALFGAGLLVIGVIRHVVALRYTALALFGVTLGKVFLFDTSSLEPIYRILGFLTLGGVLLAGSFAYSKFLRNRDGKES